MVSTTCQHGVCPPPPIRNSSGPVHIVGPQQQHASVVGNTTYLNPTIDPNLKQIWGHCTTAMSPRMVSFFSCGLGGGAFGFGGRRRDG